MAMQGLLCIATVCLLCHVSSAVADLNKKASNGVKQPKLMNLYECEYSETGDTERTYKQWAKTNVPPDFDRKGDFHNKMFRTSDYSTLLSNWKTENREREKQNSGLKLVIHYDSTFSDATLMEWAEFKKETVGRTQAPSGRTPGGLAPRIVIQQPILKDATEWRASFSKCNTKRSVSQWFQSWIDKALDDVQNCCQEVMGVECKCTMTNLTTHLSERRHQRKGLIG